MGLCYPTLNAECAFRMGHPLGYGGRPSEKQPQVSGELVGEDGAVADFAFFNFVDGLVGFVHGKALGCGFDSVTGGDVEHFAQLEGAADGAATDGALA
jgi:hypothetical protein